MGKEWPVARAAQRVRSRRAMVYVNVLASGNTRAYSALSFGDPRMLRPRNKNPTLVRALDAKFKPRRVASALIERPALVASIDRALARKVVLLLAPAGSGKTGLLYEWHARRHAQRPIAWLSVEEEDDSPQRFFSHLVGAIQVA